MNHKESIKTGKVCSELKVDIPMSPLWHMGKAAKFDSKESLKTMQNAIDYLACKAKNHQSFDNKEKEFLKEIYEAFWWGGQLKGWKEAAQLARHYVHGNGKQLSINPEVYKTSVIVKDTMGLMKIYIAEQFKNKNIYQHISSGDVDFYTKPYCKKMTNGMRYYMTQGQFKNGLLVAEQNNQRLQKCDNRFYLECNNSIVANNKILTMWFIVNTYDFKSFENANFVTDIPLKRPDLVLKIPDGLSCYMTTLGIAKEFSYRAEWHETWDLGYRQKITN